MWTRSPMTPDGTSAIAIVVELADRPLGRASALPPRQIYLTLRPSQDQDPVVASDAAPRGAVHMIRSLPVSVKETFAGLRQDRHAAGGPEYALPPPLPHLVVR